MAVVVSREVVGTKSDCALTALKTRTAEAASCTKVDELANMA